jgi:heptaprenyl diphosphate synthase
MLLPGNNPPSPPFTKGGRGGIKEGGKGGFKMELRDMVYLSLLATFAIVVHSLEMVFPSPLPWLRLGLANIMTLATLIHFGLKAALFVTLIRVLVGSFLVGSFLNPGFFLSFSGGIMSTLAMGLVISIFKRAFSPVGVSLIGAFTHNLTQIAVAYIMIVKRKEVFLLVPVILALAILTGTFNGIASTILANHLKGFVGTGRIQGGEGSRGGSVGENVPYF